MNKTDFAVECFNSGFSCSQAVQLLEEIITEYEVVLCEDQTKK